MLQISISVSVPTVQQIALLPDFKLGKGYRIFRPNDTMMHLRVPEEVMDDFHHYFEHVGAKRDQIARKRALEQLVLGAYECSMGTLSSCATEEIYIPFKGMDMVFKVTPQTKRLFMQHFCEPNKTKYSKRRWFVLSSLVMCAWISAKQSIGKLH